MGITQQIGASSLIKPGVIDSAAARPASPYEGQVIYETDTDLTYVWSGSAWISPSFVSTALTGTPTAPTAAVGNNTTQLATTAFANAAGGLVFISKTIVTAGGTFTNAFSSTYDHYKIIADVTCSINGQGMYFRGQGSAGNTHNGNTLYTTIGSTTPLVEQMSSYTTYAFMPGYTGTRLNMEIDFYNPYSATIPTRMKSTFVGDTYSGSAYGRDTYAASSTSFYFTPIVGEFTGGTITVYGYKKG